jgi:voltage-gated potassium channel Kch
MLMMSRRRGEKEWTRVMVSTYRDHVIICGLGHLGIRVVEQLLASGTTVVALERRRSARFIAQARDLGVPVMIRDMKEDQALLDAGIEYARSIVIATNDAIANLEVALDAKRMNPKIRVVMRMFDEKIAHKISDAMDVDVAFSSSTLAAPAVAKMALAME